MADDHQRELRHELRSHLMTVKGYAQFVVRLLHRPDMPREYILKHAEELERQVGTLERTMKTLVNERDDTAPS